MVTTHAHTIYRNPNYQINHTPLYGVCSEEPIKIWKSYDDKAYACLYYDGANGPERENTLSNKIFDALQTAEAQIQKGRKPTVPADLKKYISIIEISNVAKESAQEAGEATDEHEASETATDSNGAAQKCETGSSIDPNDDTIDSGAATKKSTNGSGAKKKADKPQYRVQANLETCSPALFEKGFSTLFTRFKKSAKEANDLYDSRIGSEKYVATKKSMLGYAAYRIHSDEGIENKNLCFFITSILRRFEESACEKYGIKFNKFLNDLDNKLYVLESDNGVYVLVNKMSTAMQSVFSDFGIGREELDILEGEINRRLQAQRKKTPVSQIHEMPETILMNNKISMGQQTSANSASSGALETESADSSAPDISDDSDGIHVVPKKARRMTYI